MATYPPSVRALAAATGVSVRAATASHDADFRHGTDQLAALDREQVGLVLGDVLRMLLEERHPGGLSGDDAGEVITGCAREASSWFSEVDVDVLVVVLAGALGIHPDGDDQPRVPTPLELARHACLLVAHLLGPTEQVDDYLTAAFAEILRAETVELP